MPVQPCTRDGKPGYRAVSPRGEGECFLYRKGDFGSQQRAIDRAHRELIAFTVKSNTENTRAVIESITGVAGGFHE